jgi:hypothetical protein
MDMLLEKMKFSKYGNTYVDIKIMSVVLVSVARR